MARRTHGICPGALRTERQRAADGDRKGGVGRGTGLSRNHRGPGHLPGGFRFLRLGVGRRVPGAGGHIGLLRQRRLAAGRRPHARAAARGGVRDRARRGIARGKPGVVRRRWRAPGGSSAGPLARGARAPAGVPAGGSASPETGRVDREGRSRWTPRGRRAENRGGAARLALRRRGRKRERPRPGLGGGAALRTRMARHRRIWRRSCDSKADTRSSSSARAGFRAPR